MTQIGPKDKDLNSAFLDFHRFNKVDDPLSKDGDKLARISAAGRFNRGNVWLQNGAFVEKDFDDHMKLKLIEMFANAEEKRKK